MMMCFITRQDWWPKMAAVFIFQACWIGALILFSVNPLSLFGTVGLLSCSAVHPGFQEVPSRHVLHREDLDTECFHCSTATLLSIQSMSTITQHVGHASMHPCTGLHGSRIIFTMKPVNVFHPTPDRAFPFYIMHPGHDMLQLCDDVNAIPVCHPTYVRLQYTYQHS